MSIGKVQIDIEEFLFETAEPCLDDKKGNEWLNRFRDTLQFKGRKANPLPFGIDCILEAEGFNAQQAVKRMSGVVKGELVKNGIDSPTTEQIEKALFERYGSEYITYKNAIRAKEQVLLRRERIKQRNIEESLGFTAEAPTREDGDEHHNTGNGAILESGSSADLYGEADTREGSDESATFSKNMRRVPQNEAPAHGFSGGRAAQGAMSPSPSGAAQDGKFRGSAKTQGESNTGSTVPAVRPESGKVYDQETSSTISTNEAPLSQRRTDGHSLRVGNVARTDGRSGAMPDDVQLVYDFAAAENLDPVDAYECWNVTVNERDGKTADGKKVTNWKAYVRKWCATRASNRESA